jgi:hypothetical protein
MHRLAPLLAAAAALVACGPVGGPVTGVADTHCGATVVTTSQSACNGVGTPAAGEEEVRYNAEADDDDCKYHVKFSATPVTANADVTLTATVTRKSDGQPATDADADVEAFLSETHPAPNSGTTTQETAAGTYVIGPVRFDASGRWTVKFHLYESCSDVLEASPHGHVSFYLQVP